MNGSETFTVSIVVEKRNYQGGGVITEIKEVQRLPLHEGVKEEEALLYADMTRRYFGRIWGNLKEQNEQGKGSAT